MPHRNPAVSNSVCVLELLEKLVMFTIDRDFPHLGTPSKKTIAPWLHEIAKRTAEMVIHWMRVGLVHGVMNTDNMSIIGLPIDWASTETRPNASGSIDAETTTFEILYATGISLQ